jgi:hypothetical protein
VLSLRGTHKVLPILFCSLPFFFVSPLSAVVPAGEYIYPMQSGDTVSWVSQFYTGDASNWLKSGIQVKRSGRFIAKSQSAYRRLHPGDEVVIDKSLVKTQTITLPGPRGIGELCKEIKGLFCEQRIRQFQHLSLSETQIDGEVTLPGWFDVSAVRLAPPSVPSAKPKPLPPAPPVPRGDFWSKWLIVLAVLTTLVLLALVLYGRKRLGSLASAASATWKRYRTSPTSPIPQTSSSSIPPDIKLAQDLRSFLNGEGMQRVNVVRDPIREVVVVFADKSDSHRTNYLLYEFLKVNDPQKKIKKIENEAVSYTLSFS